MTVEEMRRRMKSSEFTRWYIYHARQAQRQELKLARIRGRHG